MTERQLAPWPLLLVCLALFARSAHASLPHPACQPLATFPSTVYLFSADLDGEDGSDLFVADRSGESTIIIACDLPSLGPWDMRDTNKPLNTVVVVDVEGDGTEELIVGGPTGSSPLVGTITRLKGTQLEPGESVSVRPADALLVGETFLCVDTDDDGQREVVNYTYRENLDGSEMHWHGSDGSEGLFKLPSQAAEAWLFQNGQCGSRLVTNLGFAFNGYPQSIALEALRSHLAEDSAVQFGINNRVLYQKTPEQLRDAIDWVIPLESYGGYEGPFSLPGFLESAQALTVGPHNHCAGSPLAPPEQLEKNLIQLSAQPRQTSSCLQWFSVDFWMREDFTIEAVMLNIWEP